MSYFNQIISQLRKPENFTIFVVYLLLLVSVLAKSLTLAVILTLLLLIALIIYRNFILGFYLGVFSLSFDQIFVTTILSLKIHMLVFLATFLALGYFSLKKRKLPSLPPKSLLIPLIILFLFSVISIFFAVDKVRTARFLGALVYAFSIFIMTYVVVGDTSRVIKTVTALFGGMLVSSVVAIYQFVAFYFDISFFRRINILNPGNFARPKGLFDHTNFLANFFLVSIPILLAQTIWERHKTYIKIFVTAFTVSALIITFSRAAYIGFAISILIILFFTFKYERVSLMIKKSFSIILISIPILGMLLFAIGPLRPGFIPIEKEKSKGINEKTQEALLTERVSSSVDPQAVTNIERIQIWKAGVEMLKDNWLFGVGLENFKFRYTEYKLPEAKRNQVSAHNTYFQLLIETGIFGFLSFAWFGLALVLNSLKGIFKSKDLILRSLLIGTLAALVGLTFQNLTNSVFYYAHTWFLYGFIAALTRLSLSKK